MTDDRDRSGLEASPAFRAYQERLRSTWPTNPELAEKHGVAAGNGRFHESDMTETETDETDAQLIETTGPNAGEPKGAGWQPTRRQMMVSTGVALTALGGAGLATAQEETLNFGGDLVPNPWIAGTVTIDEHRPSWSELTYEDDSGNTAQLPAEIDDRDPEDGDETTSNVFTLRADRLEVEDYRAFPRDTYDDSGDDDEEVAVSAVDADRWESDAEITTSEGDTEIDSVRFASDGLGADSNAVATFDAGDHADVLTEFDPRKYLQVGVNVNELTSGGTVEIRVVDDVGDSKVVTIDPDGDSADDGVIATSTGSGIVSQVTLGDLEGGEIGNIVAVEVDIADADADVTLFALNADRMSRWEFGPTIVDENTDDESSETIREPSGEFEVTNLASGVVENATRYDVEIPIRYSAEHAEIATAHETEETTRYPPYDVISTTLTRIEVPTAYALEHDDLAMELEQDMPGDRYTTLESASETGDMDDEDIDGIDRTDLLGSEGTTAELETGIQQGVEYAIRASLMMTESETDDLYTAAGAAGGGATSTAGAAWNWVASVVVGFLGFVGLRSYLGGD